MSKCPNWFLAMHNLYFIHVATCAHAQIKPVSYARFVQIVNNIGE